ncbi:protein translocase subunit SecD [Rhodomicrobium vannielii ATCC 17100]|uniref:protein translocase subunit SecD n=1 Tax=Rhodomicrobium vannielii TaxID=1069 RepID=UPI0019191E17|nr:protein translocase subunit SecD [Rhodomicrobium vannielii]MBJ7533674.1 protein translocase subunit SecD [Rhodomicrobium vannielii ATCC 17100]
MSAFTLHFSRWGAVATILISVASVIFALPNVIPLSTYESLPSWAQLPRMPLGLDLRGGTHLLYQIDTAQLKKDWLQSIQTESRRSLSEARVAHSGVVIAGNQVRVNLRDPANTDAALTKLKTLAQPLSTSLLTSSGGDTGMDVAVQSTQPGVITLEPTQAGIQRRIENAISRSIEVIRRRVDPQGTTEATIQAQGGANGKDRILIQVPGLAPDEVKSRVGTTAKLTFQLVDSSMSAEDAKDHGVSPDSQLLPDQERPGQFVLVHKEVIVSGDDLVNAYAGYDSRAGGIGERAVDFEFNSRGAAAFARVTRENIGRPFAIILDGKVISAPVIRSEIPGGRGQITGNFGVEETNRLALLLRSGALPAALSIIEERSVGPSLGADSIDAGSIAAAVGFLAVSLFMISAYGLFGVFSVIALAVNIAIIMACLSLFHATLTMPGIAGIVLTMGVAVDANVLIYERIREELRTGRGMISAIEAGFDRAYATIIDSHLTALLAALILYAFGSGTVKGFAVTLSFGIVSSLFTAITLTRLMVSTWLRQTRPTALHI